MQYLKCAWKRVKTEDQIHEYEYLALFCRDLVVIVANFGAGAGGLSSVMAIDYGSRANAPLLDLSDEIHTLLA